MGLLTNRPEILRITAQLKSNSQAELKQYCNPSIEVLFMKVEHDLSPECMNGLQSCIPTFCFPLCSENGRPPGGWLCSCTAKGCLVTSDRSGQSGDDETLFMCMIFNTERAEFKGALLVPQDRLLGNQNTAVLLL